MSYISASLSLSCWLLGRLLHHVMLSILSCSRNSPQTTTVEYIPRYSILHILFYILPDILAKLLSLIKYYVSKLLGRRHIVEGPLQQ